MPDGELRAPEGVDASKRWNRYRISALFQYPDEDSPSGTANTEMQTDWLYDPYRVKEIAEELGDRGFSVTVRVQQYAGFGGDQLDEIPGHPDSGNDSNSGDTDE